MDLFVDALKRAKEKGFKDLTSQEELAFLQDHYKNTDYLVKFRFENGHWNARPCDEDD